jgi:hypothetical protein
VFEGNEGTVATFTAAKRYMYVKSYIMGHNILL